MTSLVDTPTSWRANVIKWEKIQIFFLLNIKVKIIIPLPTGNWGNTNAKNGNEILLKNL